MGRNCRVKFTYTKEWRASISAAPARWANTQFPTSTIAFTYPANATPTSIAFLGSHFCTPLGSAAGGSNPTEDYPSGLVDWSTFYEEAICFGSSISISMMQSGDAIQSPALRYILLAIASTNPLDVYSPNVFAGSCTKAELDLLDYEDLSSYPGARSGYIRSANSGPTRVKMFRKTKHMLGIKDVTDNQVGLTMRLPTSVALNSGTNFTTNNTTGTELSWIWYLRIFPMDTADQPVIMYTVRINYYTQLQSRGLILQETANII